jgi:NADPH:quinone reductase-like Zn-dependent oxidoreductase
MGQLILDSVDGEPNIALDNVPDLSIGLNDVLVAIEAAPIDPADLAVEPECLAPKPHRARALGSAGVGRVLDAGSAVDPAVVGLRVLILPSHVQGTWGDHVVVDAGNVVPVSERADALQLAMLPCHSGAAWALLHDYADIAPGEWVGLTPASSGVGQSLIALARRTGIKTLAIVERDAATRQARERGAELVLVDGGALGGRMADALGGVRLRALFDGGAQGLRELARAVEDGGRVVTFAAATSQSAALPLADRLRGVSLSSFCPLRWIRETPRSVLVHVYAELTELVEHGALHTPVAATYPLECHREAILHARCSERSGMVLFMPGKGRGAYGTIQPSAAVDCR